MIFIIKIQTYFGGSVVNGSYLNLFLVSALGALSMISFD